MTMVKSFTTKVGPDVRCGLLRVAGLDPEQHRLTDTGGVFGIHDITVLVLAHQGVREVRLSGRHSAALKNGQMSVRRSYFSAFPVAMARNEPWLSELIDEASAKFDEGQASTVGLMPAVLSCQASTCIDC